MSLPRIQKSPAKIVWAVIDATGDERPYCSNLTASKAHRAAVVELDTSTGRFAPWCLTCAGLPRLRRRRYTRAREELTRA